MDTTHVSPIPHASVAETRARIDAERERVGSGAERGIHFIFGGAGLFFVLPFAFELGLYGVFVLLAFVFAWAAATLLSGRSRKRKFDAWESETLRALISSLTERFGEEGMGRALRGEIAEGDTMVFVEAALGPPERIAERVMKGKRRHVLTYPDIRITLEDGLVVGWER